MTRRLCRGDRTNAAIVKERLVRGVPALSKNMVRWSGSILSTTGPSAVELTGPSVRLEKSLQTCWEQNHGYLKALGNGV
jgi:hypothetical protein